MKFKVIYLKENQGHGNARRISLENTSNELVALMDADDFSYPNRFEKQLALFEQNPNLDICGGHITEFVGEEENIIARREVKLTDQDIKKDLKKAYALAEKQEIVAEPKTWFDDAFPEEWIVGDKEYKFDFSR